MTEETVENRRDERTRLRAEAFNRAADLNVMQIMERLSALEAAVNNLQNSTMKSVLNVLNQQQETAADKAEALERLRRAEQHILILQDVAKANRFWWLSVAVVVLCGVAAAYISWLGAKLLGG